MPITFTQNPPAETLTWTIEAKPNLAGFQVRRSESGSPFALLATLAATARSFVDLTIQQGHTYAYRVDAVYESHVLTATVPDVIAQPPATSPPGTIVIPPPVGVVPPATSPDPTAPTPVAPQIVDPDGNIWTLSGQVVLKNGVQAAGGMGSSIALVNGEIVVIGTDNNRYQWNGSGWSRIGAAAPPVTPAPPPVVPVLPPPVAPVSGAALITKADLTYVGTFRSPNINAGAMKFPMMTVRRAPGNVLTSLWIASNGFFLDETSDLCECTVPDASVPGQVSTLIRNYGHGFLARMWANGLNPPDHISRASLFWDAEQNCVVLNYSQDYSGQNDPSFVLGFIDDSAHTVNWVGPFRSGAGTKQTQGFGCLVPSGYATTYLAGKRYAFGKNGGAIDASEAFAPVLHATVRPTLSTPPSANGNLASASPNPPGENGPDLAFVTLLGGDTNHRGKRPGDYMDVACGSTGVGAVDPTSFSRTALTGRINQNSGVGTVVWLNWSNRRGVIFMGGCSRGHCWYNTAGNGFVMLSGQVGSFAFGENMTGGTSHVVKRAINPGTYGTEVPVRWRGAHMAWQDAGAANGDYTIGETVTGATSGAHGVVTDQHRFDHCLHGIDGSGAGITGPICELDPVGDAGQPFGTGYKIEDFLWFYDELDFLPVVGSGNPWDVLPRDGAYPLDLSADYVMMKDNSPSGGGMGNCIAADEGARLILMATAYNVVGNPYACDVNVFSVAP